MGKFLLGFMIGVAIGGAVCFFLNPNPTLRIEMGRLLDRDTICLKDNTVINGWIVEKNEKQLVVEMDNGYFTLPLSQCKSISQNTLLNYIPHMR